MDYWSGMRLRPGLTIDLKDRSEPEIPRPLPPSRKCGEMHPTMSALVSMAFLQAPMAVVLCDNDSKITLVNEYARQMSRSQPEGHSMKSATDIWGQIINQDGTPEEWPTAEALQGQVVHGRERRLVPSTGDIREVLFNAAPILSSEANNLGAMVMFADVSNNKRRELIRLDHAIAAERTRIAGNIHDNVSQSLNATILEIRAASKGLSQSARVASRHLRKTLELALGSLAEARRATSVLSDDFDASQGPGIVLRGVASQLFHGSTVQLIFDLTESVPQLPPHVTRELVRIGKEALTNACKHANASKVLTSFSCDANNAVLKIADDGIGFARCIRTTPNGFGLISMQARAERLRGRLDISSSPGRGTAITVTLPVSTSCRVGE